MKKAVARIEMDNGSQHQIIEESNIDTHARFSLNKRLENASSFLVADDGVVLIVSRIHTINVTEE